MANDIKELKEMLKRILQKKEKDSEDQWRKSLMDNLGGDIVSSLAPLLKEIASGNVNMLEELKQAIKEIKVQAPEIPPIEVNVPDVILPEWPKIPAPVVNYTPPPIRLPDINMPELMEVRGWMGFQGFDKSFYSNPLPVQIRDEKGNILNFSELFSQIGGGRTYVGGSGGGKTDYLTIRGFMQSAFAEIMNADGRIKVESASGSSGLTDTELRASHLDVNQLSGSNWSVNLLQIGGNTPAGGEELNAGFLRVHLAQDQIYSVKVSQIVNSVAVALTDSTGVQYSGSNPFPVSAAQSGSWSVSISGALSSAVAVGPTPVGSADDGNPPLQIGGVARQTNPSAVAGGQIVKASMDDLGRQVIRNVQVRDLIQTAYAQISNGTETTLRAGVAGAYLDLVYILASNNSDAAVSVDIRPVSAGNVVMTLQVPANGVAGVSLPVPIPQTDTGNNWTADLPDITGTTISISALFSQEI